jgi:magnesium transporter
MITIHRSTDAGLVVVERLEQGCWIDVVDPTADDRDRLARELAIPPDFIADSLDPDQVSLVEKQDDLVLLLVRIPHRNAADAALPYVTLPVGIVVSGDSLVTICRQPHELLRALPAEHAKDLDTGEPARVILHLLWGVADRFLKLVNEIEKVVEELEDRLQRSLQNREVLELLRYQKSLVHFTTALRGNKLILERLRNDELLELTPAYRSLLADVEVEHRQAIERVEIASSILSNMMDAFASIISNNLNVVMKLLTSMTVILIIPTVFATFYGMNVALPFEDHPWAFGVIVAVSLACSLAVGLIFWKKHWL